MLAFFQWYWGRGEGEELHCLKIVSNMNAVCVLASDNATMSNRTAEQEKVIEQVVEKLRKIGDEFDKNDSDMKVDFSKVMIYLKDRLLKSLKQSITDTLATTTIE